MEASAKEETNIREIFRSFLTLSKISVQAEESALKRRSSAYVKSRTGAKGAGASGESPSKATLKSPQFLSEESAKPRSRSLIRKAKQNVRDASSGGGVGDCGVV
jgi:hypothetical protein